MHWLKHFMRPTLSQSLVSVLMISVTNVLLLLLLLLSLLWHHKRMVGMLLSLSFQVHALLELPLPPL